VPLRDAPSQFARGFAMGSADIVPGVSGGTVALVLGIYERLLANIGAAANAVRDLVRGRTSAARHRLGDIEWLWLGSLLAGVLCAIAALSALLEDLLHNHPVPTAGVFFGLVAASTTVAWREVHSVGRDRIAMAAIVAIATFALLGLRSATEATGDEIVTRPWWVFTLAGAVAICAMILPGVSGSFLLVMIGMYTEVLGAVNDRDVVALAATAAGYAIGLGVFSTVLNKLLADHHDMVLAAMVGLMIGSLRVLWPWPEGTATTDLGAPDHRVLLTVLLGMGAALAVIGIDRVVRRPAA